MSLIGVRFTLRHTERLADHTRRDAHRAYLREQRREAYSNYIAAVLEAETRIDLKGDDGGHVPLTAALRESGESISDLVRSFSVSRASIYRALQSAELMALDEAVAAVK